MAEAARIHPLENHAFALPGLSLRVNAGGGKLSDKAALLGGGDGILARRLVEIGRKVEQRMVAIERRRRRRGHIGRGLTRRSAGFAGRAGGEVFVRHARGGSMGEGV